MECRMQRMAPEGSWISSGGPCDIIAAGLSEVLSGLAQAGRRNHLG